MYRARAILVSVLVATLASSAAALAQVDKVKASARLSRHLVKLGSELRLNVQVDGTRDAEILEMPVVDGLEIGDPYGPMPTEMTQIYNGRRFYKITLDWSSRIRPESAGDFEIPQVRMRVDGEELLVPDEPLRLRVVEDLEGAEHGFFEVVDPPRVVYEGEPFTVDLRFGTDFARPADVALYLPWWPAHRGVLEMKEPRSIGTRHRLRVNDRDEVVVEELEAEERAGVSFRQFQLRRKYIATRAGKLEFDSPTFQFAEVLRAGSVFDRGKYHHYYAQGPDFAIDVLPIPEEGRPFEWTGAVGTLTAERRFDRRDLDVGDSIEFAVSWFGDGNLEFFDPPDLKRLDEFADFRVLGMDDSKFDDERRVVYDLVPASAELTEIPPVPLWVFDPRKETFVRVATEPVPIRVREVEGDLPVFGGDEEGDMHDIRDLHTVPQSDDEPPRLGGRTIAGTAIGLPLAWLLGRTLVRRRRGDPNAPLERRRRAARRRLARELATARTASAQTAALAQFLAARTREPDNAWLGRDPREWADALGESAPAGPAVETLGQCLADLDEQAWAGGDGTLDARRILEVADALQKGGL